MDIDNLISIITPTYNSEKFVSETIDSILVQTYSNWELLITDDCSIDNTWHILEDYAKKDKRIKIFRLERNSGAGIARNNSIKQASGRYIAFCDSDDMWLPSKLEKQIVFMQNTNCKFSFSSYNVIDEQGVHKAQIIARRIVNYQIMLKNNYIACLTAMYDTKDIGKIYMPKIRKRQDWALWLSLLRLTNNAFGIEEPLAIYRDRSNSISSNKFDLIKYHWALYYKIENYNVLMSLFLLLRYLFYYFKKKY